MRNQETGSTNRDLIDGLELEIADLEDTDVDHERRISAAEDSVLRIQETSTSNANHIDNFEGVELPAIHDNVARNGVRVINNENSISELRNRIERIDRFVRVTIETPKDSCVVEILFSDSFTSSGDQLGEVR